MREFTFEHTMCIYEKKRNSILILKLILKFCLMTPTMFPNFTWLSLLCVSGELCGRLLKRCKFER